MDLKIFAVEDYLLIHEPWECCLYSEASHGFVEGLIDIASRLQTSIAPSLNKTHPKAIVLLQTQPAVDWVESWMGELETEGVQKRLYENILALRWLLYLVRHSEVPWFYWSGDDTFGSHWELALACRYRYYLNSKAKIGFPEIQTGVFVAGGILESMAKNGAKIKDKWQSQPTMRADQAFKEGLIHFCSERNLEPSHQEMIATIKKRIESVRPPLVQKSLTTGFSGGFSGFKSSINLDFFSRKQAVVKHQRLTGQDLEIFYREETSRAHDFLNQKSQKPPMNAWDYCWQLIKDRANNPANLQHAAALARVAALAYYQKPYGTWLRTQRSEKSINAIQKSPTPFVMIDITLGPPPAEALVHLAEDHHVLLTSSLTSVEFMQSLEVLYSRIDRWIGHAQTAQLWSQKIVFSQGTHLPKNKVLLKWLTLESLHLQWGDEKPLVFRLIGGDPTGLRQGSLQWLGPPLEPVFGEILGLVSDQLLHLESTDHSIPWDLVFRSLLLEELIYTARAHGGDLSKICEKLRRFGWGFAADEEAWSHYLKETEDLAAYKTGIPALDAVIHSNNQFLWEVGSWKQARMLARRDAQDFDQNDVLLSQSLGFFVGYLAEWATKALPKTPESIIDQHAMLCVGFPQTYGTPLRYLKALGPNRERSMKAHIDHRKGQDR